MHREVIAQAAFNSFFDRMQHLRAFGFAPKTIVDIGAYKGAWSLATGGIFPDSRILMIEAQESKRAALETAAAQLGSRACCKIALLGASPKNAVPFWETETGSSLYEQIAPSHRSLSLKQMQTLGQVLDELGVATPDLVKLDVQGAEIEVLKGGATHIRLATVVQAELSVTPYNVGAPRAHDVIAYLSELGFVLYDMFDFKRVRERGQISQFDALFVNRESSFHSLSGFEKSHAGATGAVALSRSDPS